MQKQKTNVWMAVCMTAVILAGGSLAWSATISSSADTQISGLSSYRDTNYGSLDSMKVEWGYYQWLWYKSYVRFDTSSITESLASASLNFTLVDVSIVPYASPFAVYALNDGDAGEGWNESTITWNNAPGNDPDDLVDGDLVGTYEADDLDYTRVTLVTTDMPCVGECEVGGVMSVTSEASPALLDVLAADTDGQVTFIVVSQSVSGWNAIRTFATKENGTYTAPTLEVVPVPEPAMLTLLGFGFFAALRRKM